MTAPKKDGLVDLLEREVRRGLREPNLKPGDRIKLIETGAKLLAIRHKLDGGTDSGSFFAK